MIRRIFVEKKKPFAVAAKELKEEMEKYLGIVPEAGQDLEVRALMRYDIENLSDETYQKAKSTVFSEPPVDILYEESNPSSSRPQPMSSAATLPPSSVRRLSSTV